MANVGSDALALIMRPEQVRNRNDPQSTLTTGTVNVVDGQYADAWHFQSGPSYVRLSSPNINFTAEGAILIRAKFGQMMGTTTQYLLSWSTDASNRVTVWRQSNLTIAVQFGALARSLPVPVPNDEWVTIGIRWNADEWSLSLNGETMTTQARASNHNPPTTSAILNFGATSTGYNTYGETLAVYDGEISEDTLSEVAGMDRPWSWVELSGQTARFGPARPAYESRMFVITPRIYKATRENEIGEDISRQVVSAEIDSDIDRAGPKTTISLSTLDVDSIQDGDWVAPFLDVRREGAAPVSVQMGLFQLEQPSLTFDRTGPVMASADGSDIISLLDRSVLQFPMVAPGGDWGANIMEQVRRAVEFATVAYMGSNILYNPRFNSGAANGLERWGLNQSSGWNGNIGRVTNTSNSYPESNSTILFQTSATTEASSYAYALSDFADVPRSTRQLYLTYWFMTENANLGPVVSIRFYDGAGNAISSSLAIGNVSAMQRIPDHQVGQWVQHFFWGPVPDDAVQYRVFALGRVDAAPGGVQRARMTSLRVGQMDGQPVTRHAFPDSPARTTTPVAHNPGTAFTRRINDLLAGAGHHAVHATNDGRPTSRPLRDLGEDTPLRVYRPGWDSQIVDPVKIDRATGNVYNTIVAIKEDHEKGSVIYAVARNNSPNHPWSTVNKGVISPKEPLTISEAEDGAALAAAAKAKLARSSMQESLGLDILPDPLLTVYDIIEMQEGEPASNGRWAVESLKWGLTANDPLVSVGARRSFTGTSYIEEEGTEGG